MDGIFDKQGLILTENIHQAVSIGEVWRHSM